MNTADLRPGGTVSGPTMMTAADYALYIAILGEIGIVALAVTTQFIHQFFKKTDGSTGYSCGLSINESGQGSHCG